MVFDRTYAFHLRTEVQHLCEGKAYSYIQLLILCYETVVFDFIFGD